jgi:lipopolysaccharide/colanic/teichoic acid biosynthesis glycosyltransferase
VTDWKRVADVAVAGPLLVVTAPVQAAVAVAVAGRLGRPVLFRQRRPGRDGVPFTILKFRTMRPLDAAACHLDDASRLTSLGRFLRATSLDELPTLVNVLRGDMSLVGPRPTSFSADSYDLWHTHRLDVAPGITGLWQIEGRNVTTFDERLRLDVQYIRRRSLLFDLQLLARTALVVLRRSGA